MSKIIIGLVGQIACGKEAAKKYGCEAKKSLAELLLDQEIDVVNICTPHNTHKDIVLKVIEAHSPATEEDLIKSRDFISQIYDDD